MALQGQKGALMGSGLRGKQALPKITCPQARSFARSRVSRAAVQAVVCQALASPASSSSNTVLPWQAAMAEVKKRRDIKKIMIIGAGPIVIGQATIMTDPGMADRTYIGPMTPEYAEQILAKERPDAILPTMGGQTGLNLAKALSEKGMLDKYGVELIGAKLPSIDRAEDRELFKQSMKRIGLAVPMSGTAESVEEALAVAAQIGRYPLIIRPAFTCGGTGGGIAYNVDEFKRIVQEGIDASMTNQVLVEMSLIGWKEFELEVMRDLADNVVIVCSIENVDPMGVHTGDSITVAPSQTLTDKEYQRLRDAAVAIIREMGVECGGSNVQMAINPLNGDMIIIEMNPRVSRSSALASKATGFPIAKMAAKLAVGYTLDQIANDITQKTPASFEPSIDYVVTKIPRFAFEKFPGSKPELTTMMKSVGEVMAIGRTWQESMQKALRGMETGLDGWDLPKGFKRLTQDQLTYSLRVPNPERFVHLKQAFEDGMTVDEIFEMTNIDRWWLEQLSELHGVGTWLKKQSVEGLEKEDWEQLKRRGFSDSQIARSLNTDWKTVRATRLGHGVVPSFKRIDTCAAEFDADTPYMYSCYDGSDESAPTTARKVLILGGGPNRIGQGIEFDYCCCHASFSLRKAGFETIMMNCNPETVSTDYDTSSRLYFEPVTVEDVLNVIDRERPEGIIVQFGGQTPLKIATTLDAYLKEHPVQAASGNGVVHIWGTSPDSIDIAEDRDRWMGLLTKLNIKQPAGGMARSESEAFTKAHSLGYPVMIRPSYVLGGRAMEIIYNDEDLKRYVTFAVEVDTDKPVLVDKYLDRATELDVDALCDKDGTVVIAGIMEHIEQAGIHSGDSACSLPTQTIPAATLDTIRQWTVAIAKELKVLGLINIQFAVQDDQPYIIEANPRASRTVPFVAKAVGHPIAKYASLLMAGHTLAEVGLTEEPLPKNHVAVKEVVLPFRKFAGCDTLLGPEMRSTGEVMGIDKDFAGAYAKAQIAAGQRLPTKGGKVFLTVSDKHKQAIVAIARDLGNLGFGLVATTGTAKALRAAGIPCELVYKIHEGRPNPMDLMKNGEISLIMLTSTGDEVDMIDGKELRRLALGLDIPTVTTLAGCSATAAALRAMRAGPLVQVPIQDYFREWRKGRDARLGLLEASALSKASRQCAQLAGSREAWPKEHAAAVQPIMTHKHKTRGSLKPVFHIKPHLVALVPAAKAAPKPAAAWIPSGREFMHKQERLQLQQSSQATVAAAAITAAEPNGPHAVEPSVVQGAAKEEKGSCGRKVRRRKRRPGAKAGGARDAVALQRAPTQAQEVDRPPQPALRPQGVCGQALHSTGWLPAADLDSAGRVTQRDQGWLGPRLHAAAAAAPPAPVAVQQQQSWLPTQHPSQEPPAGLPMPAMRRLAPSGCMADHTAQVQSRVCHPPRPPHLPSQWLPAKERQAPPNLATRSSQPDAAARQEKEAGRHPAAGLPEPTKTQAPSASRGHGGAGGQGLGAVQRWLPATLPASPCDLPAHHHQCTIAGVKEAAPGAHDQEQDWLHCSPTSPSVREGGWLCLDQGPGAATRRAQPDAPPASIIPVAVIPTSVTTLVEESSHQRLPARHAGTASSPLLDITPSVQPRASQQAAGLERHHPSLFEWQQPGQGLQRGLRQPSSTSAGHGREVQGKGAQGSEGRGREEQAGAGEEDMSDTETSADLSELEHMVEALDHQAGGPRLAALLRLTSCHWLAQRGVVLGGPGPCSLPPPQLSDAGASDTTSEAWSWAEELVALGILPPPAPLGRPLPARPRP
ncbi:hypothetical protein QJQ45_008119 [Haematococcus lacustris]|nr:hypothetical protein QJQ45_008119 [Haematococcus lacustris]